jgi:fatty-acyl-CoA synthase
MAIRHKLYAGSVVARTMVKHFERPDRLPRALIAMAPWGQSIAGLVAGAAARYPDHVAVHDDAGDITYREIWSRSQAIAASLQAEGVGPGVGVGLLARNHRGFIEAMTGIAATGADLVLLNTGFAGPQVADVVEHEHIEVVLHDDDFAPIVDGCGARLILGEAALGEMARSGSIKPGADPGKVVILTSGTTGRPKGAARRSDANGIEGLAALLERIPLRVNDTQVIAAPLFHAWGFSHLLLGLSRCTTNVLARRFDAESTLQAVSQHDARVLVVVPVMLARIMALSDDALQASPTPKLEVIAASGSAIGPKLVVDVLDHFGPVLYNLYGSTEVAIATIADPDDLRTDPGTAGRVAFGVDVEIVDEHGNPVSEGEIGRVFVGGAMKFDGYTNGDDKERLRGLLSSGDMGYFRNGLLFVEGRDDDMIVSGGENVFPHEVEDLLQHHPAIADVAVVGVPDEEFGQGLAAFVVRESGAKLTKPQVRNHVKANLARHKVPREVTFVDELPRNATGKLLRRKLSDQAGSGGKP